MGLYCWTVVRSCEHGTLARVGIAMILQGLEVRHVISCSIKVWEQVYIGHKFKKI